jgi:hypothetical protein
LRCGFQIEVETYASLVEVAQFIAESQTVVAAKWQMVVYVTTIRQFS